MISIKNKNKNEIVCSNVVVAKTTYKRMKGLIGTKGLAMDEAIVIFPCNRIHTFFMKYAINVAYIDKGNKVVRIDQHIMPNRIGKICKNAKYVMEYSIKNNKLKIGDTVEKKEN